MSDLSISTCRGLTKEEVLRAIVPTGVEPAEHLKTLVRNGTEVLAALKEDRPCDLTCAEVQAVFVDSLRFVVGVESISLLLKAKAIEGQIAILNRR